jgi:hypothetical protein
MVSKVLCVSTDMVVSGGRLAREQPPWLFITMLPGTVGVQAFRLAPTA